MKKFFKSQITYWNTHVNKRIMPWKGQKDAYKIWLSEIILQQTRVQQGLSYYNKFVHLYPQIFDLAQAPDDEVFKLWEGLGYYSRCKNLLHTARSIVAENGGIFPKTYDEIIKLKGVGPYTAAAIASFAYDLPFAVVDGNVYRVLSRFFGIDLPIDSNAGKKLFFELANECLDKKNAAHYNQAVMDFGAVVCKPQLPTCQACVLRKKCLAFKKGLVNQLPVKEKQLLKSNRWFYYFVFRYEDKVLINQRTGKDIWRQLYEFYVYETFSEIQWNDKKVDTFLSEQLGIFNYNLTTTSSIYKQKLTHQNISGQFFEIKLEEIPQSLANFSILSLPELSGLAFPRFINQYLEKADFQD
ncbi:MAG: A/G-specific adenine glycosylase [Chitinophagaceae bacterium]|nr:A/G-specific adenine glycosylase [Chitinophagaceae bacterium]